ncbi:MAG: arylsulfatase [Bacteroidales bacterium]
MKYLFIFFTAVALMLCSCKREELPNIVLICADDLGWSDLGCYGSEIETPHIDRLAEQGIRFTQFYNTSKCFPSRSCLLTGVYAQQNGYADDYNLPLQHAVTLGEVLKEAGYITLWSGKHHGLENPVTLGFDHYYGLKDGACNHFNPGDQRPGEGMPARKGPPGNKRVRAWCIEDQLYEPYTSEEKDFYTTDYFTDRALEWLERYRDNKHPIFLYLAYTVPHDPLMAWPEDIRKYEGKYDQGYGAIREARYRKQRSMGLIDSTFRLSEPTYGDWESLSPDRRKEEIRKMEVYAAMVDRMDQNIGRVIEALAETGRCDNILLMFVSDNGASAEMVNIEDDYGEIGTMTRWSSLGEDWANVANTPFRYYKNFSYEGGIKTPMIACWPGQIPRGKISRYPGHFIDFMATVVEMTGAEYPAEYKGTEITPMQGESFLQALLGEKELREKPLFWEWRNGQAVRDGEWKLVHEGKDAPWELYNLARDPTETHNLAPEQPERVGEMAGMYETWKAESAAMWNR